MPASARPWGRRRGTRAKRCFFRRPPRKRGSRGTVETLAALDSGFRALLSGILCGGMSARQTNPRSGVKIVLPNMILRSAVPYTPTAFQRLLEPLDRRVIARAEAAHDGNRGGGRGENAWTCDRHLKGLLFAQLAGVPSLCPMAPG